MFRFEQPWYALMLLPVLAAVWWAWRLPPPTLLVSGLTPFRRAAAGRRPWLPGWRVPLLLTAAGLCLCVVALMRPQAGTELSIRNTLGIDIMLALDVSGSMSAYDIPPRYTKGREVLEAIDAGVLQDRISMAKAELARFVERRTEDRIGMIAFARLPYMVSPPTLDHDFLVGHLQNLKAGMLPDGTNLAGPLASATYRLKDSAARRRVVVLFTDGVNNVQDKVTPAQAAKLADQFKVTVYTVGIGSNQPYIVMPDPFGRRLQPIRDDLDEKLLTEIAQAAGGRYFAAEDADGFARVMQEIDRLEKVKVEGTQFMDYHELFSAWLWSGLGLIVLGFVLGNTRFQTLP